MYMVGAHRDQKRGIKFPGIEVTDGSESPYGFWDFNLGPLEEQPGLLTASPSLQSH